MALTSDQLIATIMSLAMPIEDVAAMTTPDACLEAISEIRTRRTVFVRMDDRLRAPLKAVGAKLAVTITPAQSSAWLDSVMISISIWPAHIALQAAQLAIFERYPFGLNSVDDRLHELADKVDTQERNTLWRLQLLGRVFGLPAPRDESPPRIGHAPMTQLLDHIGASIGVDLGQISRKSVEVDRGEK